MIVGPLLPDKQGKARLLHASELEAANKFTVAKLLNEALLILWPQGIRYESVLLFLTDAAAYMLAAAEALQVKLLICCISYCKPIFLLIIN